jgi:malonate-semialdehyde dehydrogenase (acetylating) / methylmalonate-semialdehyde dehydrogenase
MIMQTILKTQEAELSNFIGGKKMSSQTERWQEVISPIDGKLLASVPMSTRADLELAVAAAKSALPTWSKMPIKERVQVFFRYKKLLKDNMQSLTALICAENGKTADEARAEIEKSIELTEFACAMPQLVSGEVLEVSRGVECRTERYPVGIVGCIVPFNFPAMVPNWTIPNALVLGNVMIMKPSEKVPLTLMRLAELLQEAGLPDGVLNLVQGDRDIVEAICQHPAIEAARKIT